MVPAGDVDVENAGLRLRGHEDPEIILHPAISHLQPWNAFQHNVHVAVS